MLKINPIRIAALAAVIAVPTLVSSCGNNNSNRTGNVNQTEVASKGASDAIKANAINTPVYSHERNKQLDEKVRSFAADAADLEETNKNLTSMYNNLGTFGTTAEMQKYIDMECLNNVFNKFMEKFSNASGAEAVRIDFGDSQGCYDDTRDEKEKELLYSNGEPSAQDVISFYDKLISYYDLPGNMVRNYKNIIKELDSSQVDKNSIQALSNNIAYRIYLQDKLMYENEFEIQNKHMETTALSDNNIYSEFLKIFNEEFVKKAAPKL